MNRGLHVDELAQVARGPERIIEGQLCFGRVQAALFGRPQATRVGRYELLDRLGAGGSGAVYRGWDPELRRSVAVKIVGVRGASARARVVTEARALARVVHRAVVGVFDVGQADAAAVAPWATQVQRERATAAYVVMELVAGLSLDRWADGRSNPAIVSLLVSAARGLAAAHRQGVVHGDFKPSNVLVHGDLPRIVDWGLAVIDDGSIEAGQGTPGFMAPELTTGAPTPASDQYALCWTLRSLLTDPDPDVATIVGRGLREDPAQRFASLDALADALEGRRSTRPWLVGAAAFALGAWALTQRAGVSGPADPPGSLPSDAWSQAQRQQTRAALSARIGPTEPVLGMLDDWVRRWGDARSSATDGDRRRCLRRSRRALHTAVELLAGPDADPRLSAKAVVDALPDPQLCLIASAACMPSTSSDHAAAVDHRVMRGAGTLEGGDLSAGRALLDDALLLAEVETTPVRHAAALYWLGRADVLRAAPAARRLLERASAEATRCGDDATATRAATQLVWLLGADRHDPEAAEHWVRQAQMGLARLPNPGREAWLLRGMAAAASKAGDSERAHALVSKAGELVWQDSGADSAAAAAVLSDEATILAAAGDLSQAEALHRRALEIRRRVLRPGHPAIGTSLIGLSLIATARGRYEDAVELLERARDEYDRSMGEHHTHSVALLINLTRAHLQAEQPARAVEPARAAVAIVREHASGPEITARAYQALAVVLRDVGETEEALVAANRARVELPDDTDPAVAASIDALLDALR